MDLEQFLELFNPYPGNHYLQITTAEDETTDALYKMIQDIDGEFTLVIYGREDNTLHSKYPKAKIEFIKNFKQPFRALPRTYDKVIVKDVFHQHENQNGILKIIYTSLANAADIILMQEKGKMNIEGTLSLLEKFEFRSPNYIDVLKEYDLVIAKKLHMWGNGL